MHNFTYNCNGNKAQPFALFVETEQTFLQKQMASRTLMLRQPVIGAFWLIQISKILNLPAFSLLLLVATQTVNRFKL